MQSNRPPQTAPLLARPAAGWIALTLALGVAGWRLRLCAQLPVSTGDLLRNLYYGLWTLRDGPGAAAQELFRLDPSMVTVVWSNLPFTYPALALGFFTLIAATGPSLFFAKFVLTLIEAVNGLLIIRLTDRRWMGLVYWASPVSIWWVSHEGQFEPVQNMLVLLALLTLRRRSARGAAGALALLGLAVQVKITAVFLLPLFLARIWARGGGGLRWGLYGLGISLVPTALACFWYPAATVAFQYNTPMFLNPYYWNPWHPVAFGDLPGWMIGGCAFASDALLVALGAGLWRARDRWPWLAPLAFVLAVKVRLNVQFWYWTLWPVFLVPLRERRWRAVLWLGAPLLEPASAIMVLTGPWGYGMVEGYWRGLTVWTRIVL